MNAIGIICLVAATGLFFTAWADFRWCQSIDAQRRVAAALEVLSEKNP